jgi:dTDP-4-amino-4,6-dideoxygalactose transaminase
MAQGGRVRVTTQIPLTKPVIGEEEERLVLEVLRSGWLVQGAKVAEFERRIAEYCGAAHAVATTSCTTALQLALERLCLQPGDEVILPSYTFVASVNAVIHAGGVPVLVDVQPDTYNIDPDAVARAITPRTRVIMPVDQFGLAADIDAINEIARAHSLAVVEDAAPALGAVVRGRRVGALSEVTCFSFHPRKTITSSEGGMLVTNSDDIAARARLMRSHAASVSDLARHHADGVVIEEYPEAGYNFRMSDLHAAVGLAQLDRLDAQIEERRALAARYNDAFAGIEQIAAPAARDGFLHTYQSYVIVLTEAAHIDMRAFMARLKDAGIATRRGCMAVHREPYFVRRFGAPRLGGVRLPVAERLAERGVAIPLFPGMTADDQDFVIRVVTTAVAHR